MHPYTAYLKMCDLFYTAHIQISLSTFYTFDKVIAVCAADR